MKKMFYAMMMAMTVVCLTACEGNSKGPSVTNYYTISTNDHSWSQSSEMEYLFSFFEDDVRMFIIEGTKEEANKEALERYEAILAQIDNDRVCRSFPCDYDSNLEEYLYAEVDLLRTVGRPDTLARRRWSIKGVE